MIFTLQLELTAKTPDIAKLVLIFIDNSLESGHLLNGISGKDQNVNSRLKPLVTNEDFSLCILMIFQAKITHFQANSSNELVQTLMSKALMVF